MKAIATTVLALAILSPLPAFAETHEYSPLANPNIPVTPGTPESEELPPPSTSADELRATGSNSTGYVAPSKDVKLYVPLSEEQQELPMMVQDPGMDYYPGIEIPRGGKATKEINDRVGD